MGSLQRTQTEDYSDPISLEMQLDFPLVAIETSLQYLCRQRLDVCQGKAHQWRRLRVWYARVERLDLVYVVSE